MSESTPIKLKIMGREIQVTCKPGEKDAVLKAAEYVDGEMQAIKAKAVTQSAEKVAIITAMNMANELLRLREQSSDLDSASQQISAMQEALTAALN